MDYSHQFYCLEIKVAATLKKVDANTCKIDTTMVKEFCEANQYSFVICSLKRDHLGARDLIEEFLFLSCETHSELMKKELELYNQLTNDECCQLI